MTIFPITLECGYKIILARVSTGYGTIVHLEAPDGFIFGHFTNIQSAIDFVQNCNEKAIDQIIRDKK